MLTVISFGSVVVEDAEAMTRGYLNDRKYLMINCITETIFEAVKSAGVRALVSAGWGGLGSAKVPDDVFILEGMNCSLKPLILKGASRTTGFSPMVE